MIRLQDALEVPHEPTNQQRTNLSHSYPLTLMMTQKDINAEWHTLESEIQLRHYNLLL